MGRQYRSTGRTSINRDVLIKPHATLVFRAFYYYYAVNLSVGMYWHRLILRGFYFSPLFCRIFCKVYTPLSFFLSSNGQILSNGRPPNIVDFTSKRYLLPRDAVYFWACRFHERNAPRPCGVTLFGYTRDIQPQ